MLNHNHYEYSRLKKERKRKGNLKEGFQKLRNINFFK